MAIALQESLIEFVSIQRNINPARLSAETRLNHDLGIDGDDGIEFMAAFSSQFDVNLSAFESSKYFGPEGSGNPFVWLWWFVTRSWPKFVPITLGDLQSSINAGCWVESERNAV